MTLRRVRGNSRGNGRSRRVISNERARRSQRNGTAPSARVHGQPEGLTRSAARSARDLRSGSDLPDHNRVHPTPPIAWFRQPCGSSRAMRARSAPDCGPHGAKAVPLQQAPTNRTEPAQSDAAGQATTSPYSNGRGPPIRRAALEGVKRSGRVSQRSRDGYGDRSCGIVTRSRGVQTHRGRGRRDPRIPARAFQARGWVGDEARRSGWRDLPRSE